MPLPDLFSDITTTDNKETETTVKESKAGRPSVLKPSDLKGEILSKAVELAKKGDRNMIKLVFDELTRLEVEEQKYIELGEYNPVDYSLGVYLNDPDRQEFEPYEKSLKRYIDSYSDTYTYIHKKRVFEHCFKHNKTTRETSAYEVSLTKLVNKSKEHFIEHCMNKYSESVQFEDINIVVDKLKVTVRYDYNEDCLFISEADYNLLWNLYQCKDESIYNIKDCLYNNKRGSLMFVLTSDDNQINLMGETFEHTIYTE